MLAAALLAPLIGPALRAQSTPRTSRPVRAAASFAPAPANVPSAAETTKLATRPANAEVRKIDRDAGKVTLRHTEVPELDMPPMLMVFRVRNPAMLNDLKAGDKILFMAGLINGTLTVMSYVLAK